MPRDTPPPLDCVVLSSLRNAKGWQQRDLVEAVRISKKTMSSWETKTPPPEKLEECAAALGYEPGASDFVRLGLSLAVGSPPEPRSPVDPTPGELRTIRRHAARIALAEMDLIERHQVKLVRAFRARKARRKAKSLAERLLAHSSEDRRLLVETAREFQVWGLAELLCHKSEEAASDRADLALELAKLACRVAELAQGDELWRLRLLGYALAFLANARRVGSNLRGAEADFDRALRLWDEGAAADPGLLAEWRLFDRLASLRRAQRKFAEALALLDRARAVAPLKAAGRILLNRAFTLKEQGEAERAIEALREAAPLVDAQHDPHLLYVLRLNLASTLCDLDGYAEAERLLPGVRDLAVTLRKELALVRVSWLAGKVHAGLGRTGEARSFFEQVRQAFTTHGIPYDCALVTLELAALHLQQGRTGEVRRLAEEMLWIFTAQGVHREALAALGLFREAAAKEKATVELARRLIGYLNRARTDPELRFEL